MAWSSESVERFWDYVSRRDDLTSTYFSYQVGSGVTNFLSQSVCLKGRLVLDYGCGRGYLIRHLLGAEALVSAADSSPDSVQVTELTYAAHENWRGARVVEGAEIPWPKDTFDVVTCLETLEHVLPHQLESLLEQIIRVMRPGGVALFSTPNSENLLESTVCCPNCLTEFHRWQHIRSWSAEQLAGCLRAAGYEVLFCQALDFANFQQRRTHWKDCSPRTLLATWRGYVNRVLDTLHPKEFPKGGRLRQLIRQSRKVHLVAVAKKPREGCLLESE